MSRKTGKTYWTYGAGGVSGMALMLVEGILDLFVKGDFYTDQGVCGISQFTNIELTGCGSTLVQDLGSLMYNVVSMLQSVVGGLAATEL